MPTVAIAALLLAVLVCFIAMQLSWMSRDRSNSRLVKTFQELDDARCVEIAALEGLRDALNRQLEAQQSLLDAKEGLAAAYVRQIEAQDDLLVTYRQRDPLFFSSDGTGQTDG